MGFAWANPDRREGHVGEGLRQDPPDRCAGGLKSPRLGGCRHRWHVSLFGGGRNGRSEPLRIQIGGPRMSKVDGLSPRAFRVSSRTRLAISILSRQSRSMPADGGPSTDEPPTASRPGPPGVVLVRLMNGFSCPGPGIHDLDPHILEIANATRGEPHAASHRNGRDLAVRRSHGTPGGATCGGNVAVGTSPDLASWRTSLSSSSIQRGGS